MWRLPCKSEIAGAVGAIDEQINNLGNLPPASDISVPQLDKLNQKIAQQREKIAAVRSQRKAVRRQANALPVNRQLVAQAARVDAMCEHLPWIEALENQAERLRNEMESIRSTLGGEVSGLGTRLDLTSRDVRELTNQGFAALQASAKKMIGKREELESAADQVERAQK